MPAPTAASNMPPLATHCQVAHVIKLRQWAKQQMQLRLNPWVLLFCHCHCLQQRSHMWEPGKRANANQTTSQLVLNGLHRTPVCMGTMLLGAVSALSSEFLPMTLLRCRNRPRRNRPEDPSTQTLHFTLLLWGKKNLSVGEKNKIYMVGQANPNPFCYSPHEFEEGSTEDTWIFSSGNLRLIWLERKTGD